MTICAPWGKRVGKQAQARSEGLGVQWREDAIGTESTQKGPVRWRGFLGLTHGEKMTGSLHPKQQNASLCSPILDCYNFMADFGLEKVRAGKYLKGQWLLTSAGRC